MEHLNFFTLLLYLIQFGNGEFSLVIFKDVDGHEVPVTDILHENAGTNLTLTCNLFTTSNDTDYELVWGRRRKNVQFNNVMDLQKLAKNNLNPLMQFHMGTKHKKALLQFHPLFLYDSGLYFCMCLKFNLFKIAQITVKVGSELSDLDTYIQAVDNSHVKFNLTNLYKPLGFPKFMCTNDMFICNSGTYCYEEKYVCDGVKDCNDGSDENFYLCGEDACAGKKLCSNGRCISMTLCCDKFRDPYCTVNVQPSCCFEGKENRKDDNEQLAAPSHDDEFDPLYETSWKREELPKIESLWIVVPCIIILIIIIVCIMIRQRFMKPVSRTRFVRSPHYTFGIRGANSRGTSLVSDGRASSNSLYQCSNISRSISPNVNPMMDLPPSYDEVMENR